MWRRFFLAVILIILYVPFAVLVQKSLGFDAGVWLQVIQNEGIADSLSRSLVVGSLSSVTATILAVILALSLERLPHWLKRSLMVIVQIPLSLPEIVIGIGFLVWFSALHLELGLDSLWIAHTTIGLPFAFLTIYSRLEDQDPDLWRASRDLGCTETQAFWKVTWPWLIPGVLCSLALVFVVSFDDFLISFFLSSAGTDTLPVKIYGLAHFGMSPLLTATSILVLGITAVVVGLMVILIGRTASRN